MWNVKAHIMLTCQCQVKGVNRASYKRQTRIWHHVNLWAEFSWNVMAHGDVREGKWRGNWRMEWVASTLTPPRNMVYPALLTLMRTPRLPVVDLTEAPADLNRLVRFAERRNLVSAHVPSHFKRSLPGKYFMQSGCQLHASVPSEVCICLRFCATVISSSHRLQWICLEAYYYT